MKIYLIAFLAVHSLLWAGEGWDTRPLLNEFYAEGAGVGDINGDGKPDLSYGPFWFEGPDFTTKNRFTKGDVFDGAKGYSDNFFSFVHDFNGDKKNDILIFGFPGKEARLYLNPGETGDWTMHIVADQVANESPHFIDMIPGGHPEIVCARDKTYGFYEANVDATQPWKWHPVSIPGEAATPFGHGLGVGDINGDGRDDLVEKMNWYEQPAKAGQGPWVKHKWAMLPYGGGGAQILITDVDQDGDNDIITSFNAHGYGIGWFEQSSPGKFARHDITGQSSTENPYGVAFSQPHALALADMDLDGRPDFVTGKRYFAHNGKDPGGLAEPVLYWFQNTVRKDGIEFVPHLVDRHSGVGVEVKVTDLNGDKKPDIITSSKKGLFVHTQSSGSNDTAATERWKVDGGRPQDKYRNGLSPKEAIDLIEVPEGFSVDLIASEPDVTQPIAMTFDSGGRIWLVEGRTYPVRALEGAGKDRIIILEDSDGDGDFETRKVFAEGINLASGIEVGFGGVYVGAAPYLLYFADKDQDDKPDGKPEILLDGWGYHDTHETLNSFTWGPDGWLYGCHGVFTHSKVGKPGSPDTERTPINAGLWRYHPVEKVFEVYAEGTSNPWGVDFNQYGDWFISACVIPHFYHLSQHGRYQRQAGQHFNPYTFDDIKTIADHAHYTGAIRDHAFWGDRRDTRPPSPTDTSSLGGGHAHSGLAIYQAEEFPENYRGAAFFHNLHGHRIVRDHLEANGSSFTARHRPDFALTNNHDFIGVGVMQGPDGALYFSDWVDPQTCHHRDVEIWDRTNGRVFRVRYGDKKTTTTNLPKLGDAELVATLEHGNAFHARQAQRLLQERAADGTLDSAATTNALDQFEKNHPEVPLRLRALWARHVTGLLDDSLLNKYLGDPGEHLRGWAVQFSGSAQLPEIENLAAAENSLVVRRYLASKLGELPLQDRWKLAEALIKHPQSLHDPAITYLAWYGIEPLVESDPPRALKFVNQTSWPQLKEFLTRRATVFPDGRSAIMTSLSTMTKAEDFVRDSRQLLASLENLPPVQKPEGWDVAKAKGIALAANSPEVENVLSEMGAHFGDDEFFPRWREIARNTKRNPQERARAMNLLIAGGDPGLGALALEMLDVPTVAPSALASLRKHPGKETAQAIVSRLDQFSLNMRNEAINLLASRPEMALVLLQAVDSKKVPSSLISPVMLDQFERFQNDEISALIASNWMRGGDAVDLSKLKDAISEWRNKLTPKVLAAADASRGHQTYKLICGNCHQLFGEGIALGPDLTGSNRADLSYLLENVLAPSAVVGKDYLLHIFTMTDGSTISGMVKIETPEYIKVSMPGGTTTDLKVAEIKGRQEIAQSLMPAGLFDTLPFNEVANLVKYLTSSSPQSAPARMTKADPVGPPAAGVIRIEGESLVAKYQPGGGKSVAQNMSHFADPWSGNTQLWWTGGKPGDVYTLKLDGVLSGTKNLTIFPTTAPDYAQVKITINGQLQEADFYSTTVLQGYPIFFQKVNISPSEPLQIDLHITGANPAAMTRFMVGIDRIEITDSPPE